MDELRRRDEPRKEGAAEAAEDGCDGISGAELPPDIEKSPI